MSLTLKQLQSPPGWLWAYCLNMGCQHSRAVAIAPFVIRWGPNAPGELLRERLVCKDCGQRGATLRRPIWASLATGWQSFPVVVKTKIT